MSQKCVDKRPKSQESLIPNEIQSKISKPQGKYKCLFNKRFHLYFQRAPLFFQISKYLSSEIGEPKADIFKFSFDYFYKSYAIRKIESKNKRKDSNNRENKSSVTILNPLPSFDSFQLDFNIYYIDFLKKFFIYQDS